MARMRRVSAVIAVATCTVAMGTGPALASAGSSAAVRSLAPPTLSWANCGTTADGVAAGVQCATAVLPMDYARPHGATVHIAVGRVPAKDPAHRIGSLFFNFGGPGGPAVDYVQGAGAGIFADLNQRFDIVASIPEASGRAPRPSTAR